MTDTTHDPPTIPVPEGLRTFAVDLPADRLALLSGPGFEKYVLMRDRLGGKEPLALIALMKRGGFRFKSRRGMPGNLVLDKQGNAVPDLMSFREIAPYLSEMSGIPVTYETVRRWWDIVHPDGADVSPAEVLSPDEMNGPDPETLREVSEIVVKAARRKRPAVADGHAEAIRAATKRAQAPTTNPDVPPAAFLPPSE